MKNIFKNLWKSESKQAQVVVEEVVSVIERRSSGKYSPEIEQIHHEFENASELLLEEAEKHIGIAKKHPVDKVNRMKRFGFTQAKQVEETVHVIKRAEISKAQIDLLMEYKRKYPIYKFITEEQVKTICHKYNLVCGDTFRYRGFLPEKNLFDIEKFKNCFNDDMVEVRLWAGFKSSQVVRVSKKKFFSCDVREMGKFNSSGCWVNASELGFSEYKYADDAKDVTLKICAPVKDMDMTGMTIEDGYKMTKVHIPDPVVLQPVANGYLIVTAWGDEASDPIVVNEGMN